MTAPLPDEYDSVFDVPPAGVDFFIGVPDATALGALEGTPPSPPFPPAVSVAPATLPASVPSSAGTPPRGGNGRKERAERLRGRRPLLPTPRVRPGVPTDYEIVEFLALFRYATRAQIARRFYPLDAMPTQQTFDKRLGRLQACGWIEKHDGPGRWPVYQPTRLGHAGIEIETEHLPEPSLATMEHTLGLADYLIEVETGRSPVPGFDGAPVRVITERQISAEDKSPTRMCRPPVGSEEDRLFYDAADGRQFRAAAGSDRREPIFGYWDRNSGRRGFPDALIVSADWAPGTPVTGAVAVEYERSEKTGGVATYEKILRAYVETNWWTTSPQAQKDASYTIARFSTSANRLRLMPPGGRYRLVLYVCATERIQRVIEQAARNVAPYGFVWTVLAGDPHYDVAPQRTTEKWSAGKRQRRLSAEAALRQISKDRLVEHLVAQGLAEDAVAALLPATAEDRPR